MQDMCYEGLRAEACVAGTLTEGGALFSLVPLVWESNPKLQGVCLLLQYLIQSCARGGRRTVEDMCYEIRRAEACVD
jgi:hypothetical protein